MLDCDRDAWLRVVLEDPAIAFLPAFDRDAALEATLEGPATAADFEGPAAAGLEEPASGFLLDCDRDAVVRVGLEGPATAFSLACSRCCWEVDVADVRVPRCALAFKCASTSSSLSSPPSSSVSGLSSNSCHLPLKPASCWSSTALSSSPEAEDTSSSSSSSSLGYSVTSVSSSSSESALALPLPLPLSLPLPLPLPPRAPATKALYSFFDVLLEIRPFFFFFGGASGSSSSSSDSGPNSVTTALFRLFDERG